MKKFKIRKNNYLNKKTQGYYHTEYTGFRNTDNPDYINHLKNNFDNISNKKLKKAIKRLEKILNKDLPKILEKRELKSLTVCVVPRAKPNRYYTKSQLHFRETVKEVVKNLSNFKNGINYIKRVKLTKTTHLQRAIENGRLRNYSNRGKMPYPGITKQTCNISDKVDGKNILLIDDIYTKTINIDEDAIQSLLDNGARSVIFYSIGKTV